MFYLSKIVGFIGILIAIECSTARAEIFDFKCAYLEGKAFLIEFDKKATTRSQCLAGSGFLKEARATLREQISLSDPLLLETLTFLVDGTAPGEALVASAANGSPEATFWLATSDKRNESDGLNKEKLDIATTFFITTPAWVKKRYAVAFVRSLIERKMSLSALQVADALEMYTNENDRLTLSNIANFIRGEVYQSIGAYKESISYYEKVKSPWDEPLVVEAKLRSTALSWSTGIIRTSQAVSMLEELDRDWQGGELGARIKIALSRAYSFTDNFYESFLILHRLSNSPAPDELANEARSRMESIALDAFSIHAGKYQMLAHIDLYTKFKDQILISDNRLDFDAAAAKKFAAYGLNASAIEILNTYKTAGFASQNPSAALDTAEIYIDLNQISDAQFVLSNIDESTIPKLEKNRLGILQAQIASIDLREPETSEVVATFRAKQAWKNGLWEIFHASKSDIQKNLNKISHDSSEHKFPRQLVASYLATGELQRAEKFDEAEKTRIESALTATPYVAPSTASDLHELIVPADAVLELAVLLPFLDGDKRPSSRVENHPPNEKG